MSENVSKTDLFKDFSPVTPEEWKKQILKDLKAATDDEKNNLYLTQLRKDTIEGITLEPFYTHQDLPEAGAVPLRGTPGWELREEIPVTNLTSAAQQIREAVSGGADAVLLDSSLFSSLNYPDLLATIHPLAVSVSFRVKDWSQAQKVLAVLPPDWKGCLEYPLAVNRLEKVDFDNIAHSIGQFPKTRSGKIITILGHNWHNAGAASVQELAFALAVQVHYLDELTNRGLEAAKIIRSTQLSLSIDTSYFLQIAKLRAWRLLITQLATAYGVSGVETSLHVQTARWNKFRQDSYNNMLRATLESMAAVLGGAHTLTIEPYNARFEATNSFSRRIARNISTLLREESFLGNVADPAAGAYFIENLTHSLARKAWQLFQQIDLMGGFAAAWKNGFIGQEIAKVRQQKEEAFLSGKQTLVGINKYLPKDGKLMTGPVFEDLPV